MAHNLNVVGGRVSMFYTGDKPWHKLGTHLDNPATAREAIVAAGLNYAIAKEPMYLANSKVIEGKFANVRQDTKDFLGIVGDRYQIIQNTEAFTFFDSVVGDGKAIYETTGALGKGERVWILAKLPGEMVIAREDVVEKYLILTNNHNGLSCLQMYFSPVRVVCQNTLNASLGDAKNGISIRHVGNIQSKVDEARRVLNISFNYYEEFEKICKQLVDVKMDTKKSDLYFNDVLGIKENDEDSTRKLNEKNQLLHLFEYGKGQSNPAIKHTAYAAYNAVTEYVDHYKTVKNLGEDKTNQLKNIWFGTGASFKEEAFNKAVALI